MPYRDQGTRRGAGPHDHVMSRAEIWMGRGLALVALSGAACNPDKPPARTAADCTKMGARTGVSGAKTGVTTGVEGVKAAGSAVGGYFEGGSNEASRRWNEGKASTTRVAHEGATETNRESSSPDCP
jgi:hypothetical protein